MTTSTRQNKLVVLEQQLLSEALLGFNFIRTIEQAKEYITNGRVLVGGKQMLHDIEVKDVQIIIETTQDQEPDVAKDIEILYEDEDLLVINKPAPLPIHPAGKYYFNTVIELLGNKHFPVHRLDKETTGVVILAKSQDVAATLGKHFKSGKVEKIYEAIVEGKLVGSGSINYPLDQQQVLDIRHHVVVDKNGDAAHTTYKAIQNFDKYSLVEIELHTGKKHQIRAHMAAINHPLVGDKQYKHPQAYSRIVRKGPTDFDMSWLHTTHQLLHAKRIRFRHPTKDKMMTFEAERDAVFEEFLKNTTN